MAKLKKFLKKRRIKLIRLTWCDNANIIRNKAFSIEEMEKYSTSGVNVSQAIQAVPVMSDRVISEAGLPPVKDVWLKPDWLTLRLLPYADGIANVMGRLVDAHHPSVLCPRQLLLNSLESLFQKTGVQLKVAFENEFYLLDQNLQPVDDGLYAATFAADKQHAFLMDLHDVLVRQDIVPEVCHAESGPGQFEYSIGHTDPLTAADNQLLFRSSVHAIAAKHGVQACFLPKVAQESAGSGCHLHFSFWQGEQNITGDATQQNRLNLNAQYFIAGILQHLPTLMALTTPSTNSFRRLLPSSWVGAFQAWGIENREAAIRVPISSDDCVEHIELKTIDATANPYYALSGLITAGLNGLDSKMVLPKPVDIDPAMLSEAELKARHIDKLPSNFSSVLDKFENHALFLDMMGESLFKAYVAVKRAECQYFQNKTLQDEVRLLHNRY